MIAIIIILFLSIISAYVVIKEKQTSELSKKLEIAKTDECNPGYEYIAETKSCKICPKNTYSAGFGCIPCTGANRSNPGSAMCDLLPCQPGTFVTDENTCAPCTGTNQYTNSINASSCSTCGNYYFVNDTRTNCNYRIPCPPSTQRDANGVCQKCQTGWVSYFNDDICVYCNPNDGVKANDTQTMCIIDPDSNYVPNI